MITVFFAYSHRDEELRDELEIHLAMLKRDGVIGTWHDRRIDPGEHIPNTISRELEDAQIILLLVSAYFINSDYCYEKELQRAMEKHEAGSARVIPVILRPCDWQSAPFGQLKALPRDGKPVTKHPDQDDAFLEIAQAVRQAAKGIGQPAEFRHESASTAISPPAKRPRSSNLRVKREFSDQQKDSFTKGSFEYIAKFFEASLEELKARNADIDVEFTRVDAWRFACTAYRNGQSKCKCRVRFSGTGSFPSGIVLSLGGSANDGSYNEVLSVDTDGYSLVLRPSGIASHFRQGTPERPTQQGGAEYYWSLFIEPLQT